MGYNNVPVNGWPQIKKLEELDALAKKIDDMPVFTSTDRAWLDEWESALPSLAQDVSDMETDKANQVQMATAEESTTASQAYSAGDYLVLDGVLYKVTDDIAQDGTIVTEGEGKNVDLATVGGELSGLNSNLSTLNGGLMSPISASNKIAMSDANMVNHDIGYGFAFSDLAYLNHVTWFTNWDDDTNFPQKYGSGILIPGKDSNVKAIIYISLNSGAVYTNVYTSNAWGSWKQLQFTT